MDPKLRQRNRTPNSSEESLNGDDENKSGSKRRKVRSQSWFSPRTKIFLKALIAFVTTTLIVIFVFAPLVFRFSLTVRRLLVFMNYVNFPMFKNLSDPVHSFGMNCTRNFYLNHEDNNETISLGVWHILPSSRADDCPKHESSLMDPSLAFADTRPIFFYVHGNGGARGGRHRRGLYEVLTKSPQLDAHVIAFDYRGYGDSSNVWPSAYGIKNDATATYYWLINQPNVKMERVIIWGHSLGTAVSVMMTSELPDKDLPKVLILEAPFTSIGEAIHYHPYGILYAKVFPFFEEFFVNPLIENNVTNFDSISRLDRIRVPLLILHAEDDRIVPFFLGQKLHEQALKSQPKNVRKAQLIAFSRDHGYGHKFIFSDPHIPAIVDNFTNGHLQ